MIDNFIDELPKRREGTEEVDTGPACEISVAAESERRAPYAVRLRMVLALSLFCWVIIIVSVVWILF